jgi:hypothetical protein
MAASVLLLSGSTGASGQNRRQLQREDARQRMQQLRDERQQRSDERQQRHDEVQLERDKKRDAQRQRREEESAKIVEAHNASVAAEEEKAKAYFAEKAARNEAEAATLRAQDELIAKEAPADIEKAKSRKIDLGVFGMTLGEPLRVAKCSKPFDGSTLREPCQIPSADDARRNDVFFPRSKLPDWVTGGVSVTVSGGIVVAFKIVAIETEALQADLTKKYGEGKIQKVTYTPSEGNSWSAHDAEWKRPGLHVHFEPLPTQATFGARVGVLTIRLDAVRRAQESARADKDATRVKF